MWPEMHPRCHQRHPARLCQVRCHRYRRYGSCAIAGLLLEIKSAGYIHVYTMPLHSQMRQTNSRAPRRAGASAALAQLKVSPIRQYATLRAGLEPCPVHCGGAFQGSGPFAFYYFFF